MRFLAITILYLNLAIPAEAQVQWLFHIGTGSAFSTPGTKSAGEIYQGKTVNNLSFIPTAGVSVAAKIYRSICLETGIAYIRKGFGLQETLILRQGQDVHTAFFDTKYYLDYMSIPLLLSGQIALNQNHALQLGAGLNYSFLLRARRNMYTKQYTDGYPPYEYEDKHTPVKKGLIQTSATYNGTLNIFDTGIRGQLSYIWKSRFMARLFIDHSLYSLYLKEPLRSPEFRISYCGLSLGYWL